MKTLINNIYRIATILLFVALLGGCASSVTDATGDVNESAIQGESTSQTDQPDWFPTNRDQMDPIIDKPEGPYGN